MIARHFSSRQQNQQGFTLIEVLIAALVLSVGLLGLAGLQAVSQKLSYSSYLRSQASTLAYEIADAMRANQENVADYDVGNTAVTCSMTYTRTGLNAASDDVNEWKNRIACVLPEGKGGIDIKTTPPHEIRIEWNESRGRGNSNAPTTGSDEDRRDEFVLWVQL